MPRAWGQVFSIQELEPASCDSDLCPHLQGGNTEIPPRLEPTPVADVGPSFRPTTPLGPSGCGLGARPVPWLQGQCLPSPPEREGCRKSNRVASAAGAELLAFSLSPAATRRQNCHLTLPSGLRQDDRPANPTCFSVQRVFPSSPAADPPAEKTQRCVPDVS